ncbi:MAG: 16S rRNA (guanine(527)-N(7))-methyltransferase RsmG [Lysobacterales bacterium]|jgi:16S rRNA (guanine527-N7)-methyltransferase
MSLESALRAGLEALDTPCDEAQQTRLLDYLGLIGRWNRTYNLTAVREPADMLSKHLLDSLSVLPWVAPGRLLDAGTGAGLPGIPLAIVKPGLEVTLLDSAGKKVRFLGHVKRQLSLANVHPLQARLESAELAHLPDTIISRAFSSLADYAAAARHLAGGDTRILAMKGRYPREEIEALPGWVDVRSVEKLSVPGLHEQRHLVIMSVCS